MAEIKTLAHNLHDKWTGHQVAFVWTTYVLSWYPVLIMMMTGYQDIENPSWAPVGNRVHPSEFAFQKSRAIVNNFCGICTHKGELHSAQHGHPWLIPFLPQVFIMWQLNKNIRNHSNCRKSRSESGNHSWIWKKVQCHAMKYLQLIWRWDSLGFYLHLPDLQMSCSDLSSTHWGRDKMAAIFQKIFSNAFSWMKIYDFRLLYHWSLFLGVELTIFQH